MGLRTRTNALALGALLVCSGAHAQQQGLAAFQANGCAQCHKVAGVGGIKGPDLSGVGRRMKDAAIRKQILEGGMVMPAFADSLSGDEVETLVRYLHHCRAKSSKSAAASNSAADANSDRTGGERAAQ